ncbi:MAG: chromosome segregation protein SMC [Burkholderiales bacterium]|nr:chromosome segregation protein SMC [Burkholderiales bacterium]
MKLAQIKLSGFKSFVEHTTIDIKGQLVGIVGPNGCGKSNIIDAVRWVLGESSAKQLRGESMHDVIFNGSINRKAVSRASVELIFDNQQKVVSNAWSTFDEISIKRLVSRAGDSVYSINNQVVRRKDIIELFLGTGVGSKGYAVIEQGMIGRIIDAKPEELRLYLEEAAGVSKYREKRRETLSHLEAARENLTRLEDVKLQLSGNIETLSTQAQAALEYQRLNATLKELQLIQLVMKINKLQKALVAINADIENNQKLLENAVHDDQVIEQVLMQKQQQKYQEEQQVSQLNQSFNQLRAQLARLEERHKYKCESHKKLGIEESEVNEQLTMLKLDLANAQATLVDVQAKLELNAKCITEQKIAKEKFNLANIEYNYQQSMTNLTQLATQIAKLKHEIDLVSNSYRYKEQQLNTMITRQGKLKQELPHNTLDLEQDYILLKEDILQMEIIEQDMSCMLEDKRQTKAELEVVKASQLNSVHKYNTEISSLRAKVSTLEKLLQQSSRTENLEHIVANANGVTLLWQNIQVKAGYEVAVEVALRDVLSGFVIDDLAQILKHPDGLTCLWLGNNAQDSSMIRLKEHTLAAYVTIADRKYQPLYSILNNYRVAKDFNAAFELIQLESNSSIITLDGHLITPDYVIFNANYGQSHVLEQQNHLRELTIELDKVAIELQQQEQQYKNTLNQIDKLNEELTILEHKNKHQLGHKHKLQLELVQKEQTYLHSVRHYQKINDELGVLDKEIDYIKHEQQELECQREKVQLVLKEIEAKETNAKAQHGQIEDHYIAVKTEFEQVMQQLNQSNLERELLLLQLTSTTEQLEDKNSSRTRLEFRLSDIKQNQQNLHDATEVNEIELIQEQITQLVESIEERNVVLQHLSHELQTTRTDKTKLLHTRENLSKKLNESRLLQQEQILSIKNLEENIENLAVDNHIMEAVKARVMGEGGSLNLSNINAQIVTLREEIERLGLVNLKAIEDLQEVQQKFDTLIMQIEDLQAANNALESAIRQIDGESRKLLNDTYTKVNENFNHYFKILFGGGIAKLIATDNDILTAGLQIYAEPLGKKNTSLHLLSGGEKALTAMSLVFAFFNLNPAPFCMLDEVDAPLDDANTMRFCNLVRELSTNTQFVYISHNRLTMEIANQLVGVTMQEKGVSTMVEVNLIDYA